MKKMKMFAVTLCAALALAVAFGVAQPIGQTVPPAVAAHVAMAKEAGGAMWPSLVKQLCTPAETPPAAPAAAPAQAQQQPQGPPPRANWYHEPLQVFDNMWLFPTADVGAWAVKTSAGIILLDTTYGYSVKELMADNMVKVGLNPADVKAIFVTHGHGDHFGGVKYFQELYSPKVFLGAEDWDSMLKPPATPNPNPSLNPLPRRDSIATDMMKYTLGDTTITVVKTPGHTAGTISFLVPVKLNGQPHVAAMWGGTAIGRGTGVANLTQYSASARKFAKVAADVKADVMLSNHERFGEANRLMELRKSNPKGSPDPFVRGIDGIQRYTQVLDHCAQAIVTAINAATPSRDSM